MTLARTFASRRTPSRLRPTPADRTALAGEEGSGSVAGVGVLLAVCAVLLALAPLGAAVAARQRLVGAADSAALAAADASSGRRPDSPCGIAAAVAAADGAHLTACAVDPAGVAAVTVSTTVVGWPITAAARAGPPPGQSTMAST
ncbi:Rv3654c family TadE-like protein [Herbiconiux sp. 11R-BC]|uniref:Rv3654c family TadE-like protein n=1 Tax=Herbiconiux sp. 11R-BC TaxID=3111637 RepID=UPI003C00C517